MKTKFTEGIWTIENSSLYSQGKGIFDEKGIAYICHVSDICGQEEAKANANLIANAPRMLEGLVMAYNLLWNGNQHDTLGDSLRATICHAMGITVLEFEAEEKPIRFDE